MQKLVGRCFRMFLTHQLRAICDLRVPQTCLLYTATVSSSNKWPSCPQVIRSRCSSGKIGLSYPRTQRDTIGWSKGRSATGLLFSLNIASKNIIPGLFVGHIFPTKGAQTKMYATLKTFLVQFLWFFTRCDHRWTSQKFQRGWGFHS